MLEKKCAITGADICALGREELDRRLAWIGELNRAGLLSHRRSGNGLELTYDASVAHRVRELVHRERACCGFLEFRVRDETDAIVLTVEGPGESWTLLESTLSADGRG